MSLQIQNAIAHRIHKERHQTGTLELRESCLENTEVLKLLVDEIDSAYKKRTGKSFGEFEPDEDNYPTSGNLRSHFEACEINFIELSKRLMTTLLLGANSGGSLATGGGVLMLDVGSDADRWFVVAILTDKAGAQLDSDLNLVASEQLDIDSMRFAGRVNVTDWLAGEERYVSFLKGGSAEVSGYFQDFLGCTNPRAITKETTKLVTLVKEAIHELDISDADKEAANRRVYEYLDTCARDSEPYSISTLANTVSPQSPEIISEYLANSEHELSDGFIPTKNALTGLVRFEARAKRWQLKFDRNALIEDEIRFDAESQTLTIRNLTRELIDELSSEFYADEEDE